MPELLRLLSRYGYTLLFASLFLQAIGLPIPALPVVLASGAAAAYGTMKIMHVAGIALFAMVFGDLLLYLVGRYSGWALLGILCRLSANPETCILKSAQSFYRRGRLTLIWSKYVPGIGTLAPPLAGSLNMGVVQFLGLDLLASCLYVLPIAVLGFYFNYLVSTIVDWFLSLSRALAVFVLLAVLGYLFYRLRYLWKDRSYQVVPRITVDDLAERMASNRDEIIVADTRSHGYYDRKSRRIKGSIRLEPNNLRAEMEKLPREKKIYLYCT
jgi:membrane protein DedA with SNARE-associated domain